MRGLYMKEKQKTTRKQIADFLAGAFDAPDRDTQCDAGWYDWFCRDSSLVNKTKKLYKKLIRISKSKKFNLDKTYVFFKNNCPMYGSLYDDFRICDIRTGNVIFTITPSNGHSSGKGIAEVWGKENDFQEPLVEGKWKDVVNWFLEVSIAS